VVVRCRRAIQPFHDVGLAVRWPVGADGPMSSPFVAKEDACLGIAT
jgi:hypothetical protein